MGALLSLPLLAVPSMGTVGSLNIVFAPVENTDIDRFLDSVQAAAVQLLVRQSAVPAASVEIAWPPESHMLSSSSSTRPYPG